MEHALNFVHGRNICSRQNGNLQSYQVKNSFNLVVIVCLTNWHSSRSITTVDIIVVGLFISMVGAILFASFTEAKMMVGPSLQNVGSTPTCVG